MPKPVILQIPQPTFILLGDSAQKTENGTRPKVDFIYTVCILFPDQRSHSKYCLICIVQNNINQPLNHKTNIRNPAQNPCQFISLSQTSLMLCTQLFLMCCQWKFHLVLTNFQFLAIDSIEDKLFKRPCVLLQHFPILFINQYLYFLAHHVNSRMD